jgi:hypothetical protein
MMRKETTDPVSKGHCFPRVLEIEALEAEEQSKKASTSKVSTSKVSTSKAEELCKGRKTSVRGIPWQATPTDSLKRPRPTHQPKNVRQTTGV